MKGNFHQIVASSTPVLVDFHATWCGPCKAVPPILKKVKESLKDSVTIVKIDIDKNRNIAEKFNVQAVPTLMLFKYGKVLWRQSGVQPADKIIKVVKDAS